MTALAGRRVLVSAGPTYEDLDPVRFLGNRSSGKMGFAVAEAARDLGMVASAQPAFIRLEDGRVLGKPAPASGNDAVQITPGPVQKPAQLERKTVVVAVDPETGRPLPRGASAANGD